MSSYHDELVALGQLIGSDGCTSALQIHVDCCLEHDWSYVTGTTPRGRAVTKAQADERFRDCLQGRSSFRFLSPMAGWRWLAVHVFGQGHFQVPAVTVQRLLAQDHRVNGPALDAAHQARLAILAEAR